MGYIRHHAIIVTSADQAALKRAHDKAFEIFKDIAPITPEAVNGYASFLIAPDGGKEGRERSEQGDVARDTFIAWLEQSRNEDGFTELDYVEAQFGDDEGVSLLLRAS